MARDRGLAHGLLVGAKTGEAKRGAEQICEVYRVGGSGQERPDGLMKGVYLYFTRDRVRCGSTGAVDAEAGGVLLVTLQRCPSGYRLTGSEMLPRPSKAWTGHPNHWGVPPPERKTGVGKLANPGLKIETRGTQFFGKSAFLKIGPPAGKAMEIDGASTRAGRRIAGTTINDFWTTLSGTLGKFPGQGFSPCTAIWADAANVTAAET